MKNEWRKPKKRGEDEGFYLVFNGSGVTPVTTNYRTDKGDLAIGPLHLSDAQKVLGPLSKPVKGFEAEL